MVEAITSLIRDRSVVVLTGAGVSTESGIPDYRGPSSSQRLRKPVQYQEFVRSEEARRRYWARSAIGWSRISNAVPNRGHIALAALEQQGIVKGIITQNVDGLHHAAGSSRVVELHGSLAAVRCLECNTRSTRSAFQDRLLESNPRWAVAPAVVMAPDGDAEINDSMIDDFAVPSCDCGGVIKPDVVFFGENVPANVVRKAWEVFHDADVLLVVGSSLEVYSGRRFIYKAQERSIPIGIINLGSTRADDCAAIKIEAQSGVLLSELAATMCTSRT